MDPAVAPFGIFPGQPADQGPDVPAGGRPVLPRMDLAAQCRRAISRCQRRIVSGVTSSRRPRWRAFGIVPSSAARSARSAQFSFGRRGCRRCSAASWWRRIKISVVFHVSSRRVARAEVSEQDAQALARSVPGWPAFPDSRDALSALGKRYKLIILSNVDRESFAGSNRRLGVRFTSVLTAQDIGSYKPSPRNFEALAAEASRLGIPRGRLLHVAQSLFHDHVPAKKAGLPTAWINRRHDRPGWGATPAPPADVVADWEFRSMAAFADAVAAESDRPA